MCRNCSGAAVMGCLTPATTVFGTWKALTTSRGGGHALHRRVLTLGAAWARCYTTPAAHTSGRISPRARSSCARKPRTRRRAPRRRREWRGRGRAGIIAGVVAGSGSGSGEWRGQQGQGEGQGQGQGQGAGLCGVPVVCDGCLADWGCCSGCMWCATMSAAVGARLGLGGMVGAGVLGWGWGAWLGRGVGALQADVWRCSRRAAGPAGSSQRRCPWESGLQKRVCKAVGWLAPSWHVLLVSKPASEWAVA